MDKKNMITIIDENGKEVECEIIFTFGSEIFNHNYVVFKAANDEFASAAIYVSNGDGSGRLEKIETAEEWDLVEEAFEQYFSQQSCGGCSGNCSGCSECCEGEDCDCSE